MNPREVAFTGLFTALTAVGAQISIPLGPVPVTLQVLMVLLSGLVLGPRVGFLSQIIYVLAGAVGLPVFAGFSGGFSYLYGPTGGYLLAFPLAAFFAGYLAENFEGRKGMVIGSFLGVSVIYLLGWLRLAFFLGGDFHRAFLLGVLPFVPIDVAKAVLAVLIAARVKKAIDWR
ncbi:biotin transporter BioY [Thermococcus sp. MAR1]|uniref:biotin transporter BioY n=1 Tax=Thermococcus sp. MAR1 TaxID=1638263 RepID=UPI00143B9EF8|nr:biotin transporter BioY [Thermococcus sp. MAR1]NJE10666.1 biotin transporter BioY [Thermococcus sp. MAR1]